MLSHLAGSRYQLEGIPNRFETGTPNIQGTIGLGAAIDFPGSVGTPLERMRSGTTVSTLGGNC